MPLFGKKKDKSKESQGKRGSLNFVLFSSLLSLHCKWPSSARSSGGHFIDRFENKGREGESKPSVSKEATHLCLLHFAEKRENRMEQETC